MKLPDEIKAVLDGESEGCIVQGDCLEVMATMPDGCVDAVVTDPPYGMEFVSNFRKQPHDAIRGDCDTVLAKMSCEIPANHSRYVFARWDTLYYLPKPKSIVTWVKNNWSMGDLCHEHARQTELILFFPGDGHRWPSNRPTDVVRCARTQNDLHPTQKPVDLMESIVSWTDGIVFDPFCGSGTTCVAAKKLGRRYIGIELSEKYCRIARNRVQNTERPLFTGGGE